MFIIDHACHFYAFHCRVRTGMCCPNWFSSPIEFSNKEQTSLQYRIISPPTHNDPNNKPSIPFMLPAMHFLDKKSIKFFMAKVYMDFMWLSRGRFNPKMTYFSVIPTISYYRTSPNRFDLKNLYYFNIESTNFLFFNHKFRQKAWKRCSK